MSKFTRCSLITSLVCQALRPLLSIPDIFTFLLIYFVHFIPRHFFILNSVAPTWVVFCLKWCVFSQLLNSVVHVSHVSWMKPIDLFFFLHFQPFPFIWLNSCLSLCLCVCAPFHQGYRHQNLFLISTVSVWQMAKYSWATLHFWPGALSIWSPFCRLLIFRTYMAVLVL